MLRLCGNDGSSSQKPDPTQIPKKTLQRLLELSSELTTEDELTPTQAWALLYQQPQFANVGRTQIVNLAESLLHHITCYG